MCANTFSQIETTMLSLGKPLQIETCYINITSYTQDQSPITKRAWIDISFQEMSLAHPIYICSIDTEPLLIGQDLLDRLAPLIDCHQGRIWAQVDNPKPLEPNVSPPIQVTAIQTPSRVSPMHMPLPETDSSSDPIRATAGGPVPRHDSENTFKTHNSFLCSLYNENPSLYVPRIKEDVFLNGVLTSNTQVALWSDKSAISMETYTELCKLELPPLFVRRCHRLLSADMPQTPIKATGVCAISVRIGKRQIWHFVSVVPQLHSSFLVGADLLIRLGTQVDTINQVLWSQVNAERYSLSADPAQMLSGQTIPQACQVASEVDMVIPPRTAGAPIRLEILKGQRLPGPQAFFQPLPPFQELNLAVCGTPLLEVNHRTTYVLVKNPTHCPVQLKAHQVIGMLIDSSFHDFELTVPIIGELPPSLAKDDAVDQVLRTFPTNMITVMRHESLQDEAICGASLTTEGDMGVCSSSSTRTGHPRGCRLKNYIPVSRLRSNNN